MKTSSKLQKTALRIALIIMAVSVLLCAAFFMFAPRNDSKPTNIVVPEKDTVSEGTADMRKPLISEDSIRREIEREQDQRREGYRKEQERFDKVLQQASDKELLIVLKYAIIHHYVPTYDVDPYYNIMAGVGSWHRTKMIYDKLSRRPDLLRKIYPNLGVLRDYVNRNEFVQPFTDTVASQTILRNSQKDGKYFVDSLMGVGSDSSSLAYKYFGTPLMR